MYQAVYGGYGHHVIREDLIPFAEWLVGGDDQAATLIAVGDELEQNLGFCIRFFHVANIVNDDDPVLVQSCHGGHQIKIALGLLQVLNQGDGREQFAAHPLFGELMAQGIGDVGFTGTTGPNQQHIVGMMNPVTVLLQLGQCGVAGAAKAALIQRREGAYSGERERPYRLNVNTIFLNASPTGVFTPGVHVQSIS